MTTKTTAATFTPDTMTVNGQTFPVEYSVTPDRTVYVFLTATVNDQDRPLRIKIAADDPRHAAALAAARPGSIKPEAAQEAAAPVEPAPAPEVQPEPIQAEAAAPVETEALIQAYSCRFDSAISSDDPYAMEKLNARWQYLVESQEVDDEIDAYFIKHGTIKGEPNIAEMAILFQLFHPAEAAADLAARIQTEAPARCLGFEELPHRPRKANAASAQAEAAAPVETEAPAQAEAAPAGRDPKQARGPVPEKDFIGQVIKGQGWKIVFDGSEERTRVIFLAPPPQAAEKATQEAGFFWSPLMKSWNKKLSFKAYRAAQGLALQLKAICG